MTFLLTVVDLRSRAQAAEPASLETVSGPAGHTPAAGERQPGSSPSAHQKEDRTRREIVSATRRVHAGALSAQHRAISKLARVVLYFSIRSYWIPGSYVTRSSMSAPSNALPRLRTLCTNSK